MTIQDKKSLVQRAFFEHLGFCPNRKDIEIINGEHAPLFMEVRIRDKDYLYHEVSKYTFENDKPTRHVIEHKIELKEEE